MKYRLCVVILSGCPLTGKSTIAGVLAKASNLVHLDSDRFRFELLGHTATLPPDEELSVMIRAYRRMHDTAASLLAVNRPVVISATYWHPAYHEDLRRLLAQFVVPLRAIQLEASDREIRRRLESRRSGQVDSDVQDYAGYLRLKRGHHPLQFLGVTALNTDHTIAEVYREVVIRLQDLLADG